VPVRLKADATYGPCVVAAADGVGWPRSVAAARRSTGCGRAISLARVITTATTTTAAIAATVANFHDSHDADDGGSSAMRVRTRATNSGEGSTASIA